MSTETQSKITVLGKTFNSDEERRSYFREELRKKLPKLKKMEGFPIGEDEDILNLSDAPYYTACPNPWLNDFIAEWEEEKMELEKQGKRNVEFEVNLPYAVDVEGGKNDTIFNAHSYHTKIPHQSIIRYLMHYTQPGDIVFDGFGGTGMTAVAASHCGNLSNDLKFQLENEFNKNGFNYGSRKSIVSDLSPIATHISYGANKNFNNFSFKNIALKILLDVEKELGSLYKTRVNDKSFNVNYIIWSDIIICSSCNSEVSYWDCSYDNTNKKIKPSFSCPKCNYIMNKRTVEKVFITYYDEIAKETLKVAKTIPVIINYGNGKTRDSKLADSFDLKLSDSINFDTIDDYTILLPSGYNLDQPIRSHGYKYLHQLYTKRNWLIIKTIFEKINEHTDDISHYHHLVYWFTASLNRLNKFNRYSINHSRHVGPLSNTLYVSATPTEISPFYFFSTKLDTISKAKFIEGGLVNIASATSLNINDNSIDYIFNDPPYGGNIMYSELNLIDEYWLKIFTNNKKEAIENSNQNKGKREYQQLMFESLKEYFRILKPGKWMSVIFSNTNAATWNAIQLAIQNAGFVIADVSYLNTNRPGLHGIIGPVAVKQPLVISCYKPSTVFDNKFSKTQFTNLGPWTFIEDHLLRLPIHIEKNNTTTPIIERSPKILFDRLIAFYVQRALPVPIDGGNFQQGLRERYIERDGMFFTNEQVQEYDSKKAAVPNFTQLSIFVTNEQDSIYWLRSLLEKERKAEQDIQPLWMKEVAGNMRTGDVLPEMRTILEENFLKDIHDKWYVPDHENEADLEKLRNKRLLKQFEVYKTEAANPKAKIKEFRVEALRAGFKQCYQDKDFKTIVTLGDRIPNNLLMEDEILLQFYDIASSRV
jgi:DNA modification methylase